MAFDHGPNRTDPTDGGATAMRNSRIGLALFGLYLLLYGSFVLTAAFAPAVLDRTGPGGVTLSVLAGVALIAAAFLLALLYGWLCRTGAPADRDTAARTGDQR